MGDVVGEEQVLAAVEVYFQVVEHFQCLVAESLVGQELCADLELRQAAGWVHFAQPYEITHDHTHTVHSSDLLVFGLDQPPAEPFQH